MFMCDSMVQHLCNQKVSFCMQAHIMGILGRSFLSVVDALAASLSSPIPIQNRFSVIMRELKLIQLVKKKPVIMIAMILALENP